MNTFPFVIDMNNNSIDLVLDINFYYHCENLGFKKIIFDIHSKVVDVINGCLYEQYTGFVLNKIREDIERLLAYEKVSNKDFVYLLNSYQVKQELIVSDAVQRISILLESKFLHEVNSDEQVVVYYNEKYCGRFKRGVNPTREQVEDRIINCGYYGCEVKAYLDRLCKLEVVRIPEK